LHFRALFPISRHRTTHINAVEIHSPDRLPADELAEIPTDALHDGMGGADASVGQQSGEYRPLATPLLTLQNKGIEGDQSILVDIYHLGGIVVLEVFEGAHIDLVDQTGFQNEQLGCAHQEATHIAVRIPVPPAK